MPKVEIYEDEMKGSGNVCNPPTIQVEPSVQGLVYRVRDELKTEGGQLFLHTRCGETVVRWLVDTGAVVTLMSFSVWESLAYRPSLQGAKLCLVGATGADIKTSGTAKLRTDLEGIELEVKVIVADIAVPAIIGMDTLAAWGAVINTEKGTIGLGATDLPGVGIENDLSLVACLSTGKQQALFENENPEMKGCFVNFEKVKVMPYSQLVVSVVYCGEVPVERERVEGTAVLLQKWGLRVTTMEGPGVEVRELELCNDGPETKYLPQGQCLAVHQAEPVPDFEANIEI